MKILGILGSSRKKGNTEILLDVALEEAQRNGASIFKISLRSKNIAPCNGCRRCVKTGKCVINDFMQEIYKKMLESEAIIWATPVYFWSMTGQMKIVIDRTYALAFPKLQLMNKVGGIILVAGRRGCINTANLFHMYFSYNHMFFAEVASGYASEKGQIQENNQAKNSVKAMVRQVISLVEAKLKYPGQFDVPLTRLISER